jgi:hypothetical protein
MGPDNLTSTEEKQTSTVSQNDVPDLPHREKVMKSEEQQLRELAAAFDREMAAELDQTRQVYMLAGMVAGLIVALWLVLTFLRREI